MGVPQKSSESQQQQHPRSPFRHPPAVKRLLAVIVVARFFFLLVLDSFLLFTSSPLALNISSRLLVGGRWVGQRWCASAADSLPSLFRFDLAVHGNLSRNDRPDFRPFPPGCRSLFSLRVISPPPPPHPLLLLLLGRVVMMFSRLHSLRVWRASCRCRLRGNGRKKTKTKSRENKTKYTARKKKEPRKPAMRLSRKEVEVPEVGGGGGLDSLFYLSVTPFYLGDM